MPFGNLLIGSITNSTIVCQLITNLGTVGALLMSEPYVEVRVELILFKDIQQQRQGYTQHTSKYYANDKD